MSKKLAIVGTAPSGVRAPFNDPSWDIWGVGLRASHVTRATRWYELHRLDGEVKEWAAEWRRLMRDEWPKDCDVWMFYPENDLGRKVVRMDPRPLQEKYGTFFMTSSFAWMLAQAIEEKFETIGIWGVDMEFGTEYRQQRSGVRHFMAIAKMLGINIEVVLAGGVAYEPVPYPFWMDDPLICKNKLRQASAKAQMENSKFVADGLSEQLQRTKGQRSMLAELIKLEQVDLNALFKRTEEKIESLSAGLQSARDDFKRYEGSLEESRWLEDYLQP